MNWNRKLVIFFAGVLILSMLGPFNTYEALSLWERVIFWSIVFGGVGLFMHIGIVTLLNAERLTRLPQIVRIFLGSLLAGLPATSLVYFVYAIMVPPMIDPNIFPMIWAQVTLMGTFVGFIEFADRPAPLRTAADEGSDTQSTAETENMPEDGTGPLITPFHKRLPTELGHDIISVSMHDHYAEVTTTLGNHMILMRFGDVLSELEGAGGVRLHRSHWASCRHIRELFRKGNKTKALLSDGRKLPVSASCCERVEESLGLGPVR